MTIPWKGHLAAGLETCSGNRLRAATLFAGDKPPHAKIPVGPKNLRDQNELQKWDSRLFTAEGFYPTTFLNLRTAICQLNRADQTWQGPPKIFVV